MIASECRWAPLQLVILEDAWSAYSGELLHKLFCLRKEKVFFNVKDTLSCRWLRNAGCYVSPPSPPLFFSCTDTNESQPRHILISTFVTICFFFFLSSPLLDVLLIEQSLAVHGPTLIRRNSHRLYKNPLGIPISVLIPLSIEGNNINHIISHQGDKVGLALSVSCRKSCSGFFSPHLFIYWISLDALALMLLFMSGKLLFDIQIMWEERGGVLFCVREAWWKLHALPATSPQSVMMDWF